MANQMLASIGEKLWASNETEPQDLFRRAWELLSYNQKLILLRDVKAASLRKELAQALAHMETETLAAGYRIQEHRCYDPSCYYWDRRNGQEGGDFRDDRDAIVAAYAHIKNA